MHAITLCLLAAGLFAGCRTPVFLQKTLDTMKDNRVYTTTKANWKKGEAELEKDLKELGQSADRQADKGAAKTDSYLDQGIDKARGFGQDVKKQAEDALAGEKKSG